jgi:c-di-GMP-binding flagellar brake protein YcgR
MAGPIYEVAYQKRRAFSTRLPDHYTRLQRREFFRLVLPMTRRPPCVIRQEGKPVLNLSVVDISIGGVAAELPGGGLDIELGQILPKTRIDLKTIGTMEVDLQVANRAEIQRGGKPVSRIGCNFVKLSHAMENQLQRFITEVQREERARLGG